MHIVEPVVARQLAYLTKEGVERFFAVILLMDGRDRLLSTSSTVTGCVDRKPRLSVASTSRSGSGSRASRAEFRGNTPSIDHAAPPLGVPRTAGSCGRAVPLRDTGASCTNSTSVLRTSGIGGRSNFGWMALSAKARARSMPPRPSTIASAYRAGKTRATSAILRLSPTGILTVYNDGPGRRARSS